LLALECNFHGFGHVVFLGALYQPLRLLPERFRAKWLPVRVRKTRQNKKIKPRSDSIGTGL
jgi:hypothetical protein